MEMEIVVYPDPILKRENAEVTENSPEFQEWLDEFVDALYEFDGLGLAAPQVGKNIRVFVVDYEPRSGEKNFTIYINPKILEYSTEKDIKEEGCLSVPNIYGHVERPTAIKIKALDRDFNPIEKEITGFEARVFQHEYDHLEGKLFVDKVTTMDRFMIKNKLTKLKKAYKK